MEIMTSKLGFCRTLLGHSLLCLALGATILLANKHCDADMTRHSRDHEMHMHQPADQNQDAYVRSEHTYVVPDVSLISMDGKEISLNSELNSETPTLLNFIFTSCSAICPIMTSTFSQVQKELTASPANFKMVSISIDPEQDTPKILRKYATKYQAGSRWDFFTGERATILKIQRAFNAYRGNKMNHVPITFMRASKTDPWVRIEGFTSAKELIEEYQKIVLR